MKKFLLIILVLVVPLKVNAIAAESYAVMDFDTGRILESKNLKKQKLIASTTKIMTCLIALEKGDLLSIRKIGEEVLKAYGSAIYISVGEEITLNDLLYGLMLRSGNDAAIEIAYHISGNILDFVKLMNEKAYELGMKDTIFLNPSGLEEDDGQGNMSTALDMAILMRYALKNEKFKEIIHTKSYTAKTSGKTYVWKNKNKLLHSYDSMLGGKTGYTEKAKRTLVTASMKNEKTCIVVTLNDGQDFADHKNLCESVFKKYERVLLVNKDNLEIEQANKYYINSNIYALLTEEEKENIKINYQINQTTDNEVGAVEIYLNDELLISEKIFQRELKETKEDNFFVKFLRWLFKW